MLSYLPAIKPRAMTRKQREKRTALRRKVVPQGIAGAKLLKTFNRSSERDRHASKPQYPCYGGRSER